MELSSQCPEASVRTLTLKTGRQSVEDRPTEVRVARHVPAHEPRDVAAAAGAQRAQVARLDLRRDPVVRERRPRPLAAAHVVRIPVRKDDDVSGRERDGLSIFHLDHGAAVDHQMVEDQVRRTRRDRRRHHLRRRRREPPGRREFGGEEHGAVQLDAAQDFGECIHSVLWTPGKVPRSLGNGIRSSRPFEQVMETLGHGSLRQVHCNVPGHERDATADVDDRPVRRTSMNPNKALWEKGDFTRIAASMRESGEAVVAGLGITKGLKVLDLGCGDGTTALPEARLGADVLGVDIASNLVEAGNRRAQGRGPDELPVPGRRRHQSGRARRSELRPRRQHLRRHVRAQAVRRRQGDGARDQARRPDRDGELDSRRSDARRADSEDQLRLLAAAARGLRQPDDVGHRGQRDRALRCRRDSSGEDLVLQRHVHVQVPGSPSAFVADFRDYYGPTMNAFAAAEQNGKAADLQQELEALFERQNQSASTAPRRFRRRS